MALFHNNAVITGLLDSYCLLCEVHLRKEDEIKKHIASHHHKKNLEATSYIEKYKDDRIRKVKQGYYCTYCNKLFLTVIKVGMHVSGGEHRKSKDIQQLHLRGNAVVAFNKVALHEDAWHSLVDGSCAICNTEYVDQEEHKTDPAHILKLVQSSVELDSNGAIYRKGEDSFYCLVCSALFPLNMLKTHFELSDHITLFNKCCESYTNQVDHNDINAKSTEITNNASHCVNDEANIETTNLQDPNNEQVSTKDIDKSKESTVVTKKPITNTGDVSKKNKLKSTEKTLCVSTNFNTVDNESLNEDETENEEIEVVGTTNDKKVSRAEKAKKFAEENNLKYTEGTSSVFCSTCNVTISSSLKRMKEHVAEMSHIKKSEPLSKFLSNVKPMKEFILEKLFINRIFDVDVVINESFCLSLLSFSLMTDNQIHLRCQVCEKNVLIYQYDYHRNSLSHRIALGNTPVLLSLKNEFVREVRPGLYHCGFCNIIEGSWIAMRTHFKSINHKEKKAQANRQLREHLPDIQEFKKERAFHRMMNHLFN